MGQQNICRSHPEHFKLQTENQPHQLGDFVGEVADEYDRKALHLFYGCVDCRLSSFCLCVVLRFCWFGVCLHISPLIL